jgi:molybdopterin converting factor small subunit
MLKGEPGVAVKVRVKLTEPIWRTVGARETMVELPEGSHTLEEVLTELGRQHPRFAEEIYVGTGHGGYHYGLFLNEQAIGMAKRGQVDIKDGDEIFILLPVAGGTLLNEFKTKQGVKE